MQTFTVIGIFLLLASCDARTRRRRRNMYNDRPCGPGQQAILSKSKKLVLLCEQCPKNTYRPDTKHSMEACIKCEAGRVSSEDFTHCIGDICRAGTYGASDSTTCSSCEIGKYSIDGQFSCTDCESGRYNNDSGQGSCSGEKCPGGKYGLIGQSEKQHAFCTKCPEGKWSSDGSSQCNVCASGKYSRENADTCVSHEKCSRDMYYTSLPSATSEKIACSKCIHYSKLYFYGFVISCIILGVNIILYLYKRKNKGYIVIMFVPIIWPLAWLLNLNYCNGNPRDGKAIISIIFNVFCIIPLSNVILDECKRKDKSHFETKHAKPSIVCKNSLGKDMVSV